MIDERQYSWDEGSVGIMTIRRQLFCCVSIIAALACSIFVLASPKDKDKDNDTEVKFTARSELVLIPTLVTDKSRCV